MSPKEWSGIRLLVAFLLVFQLVSVVLMWSLNPIDQRSEAAFALLLASDLVAFSIIAYVARLRNLGVRGAFVLMGSAAVLLLMFLAVLE